MRSLGCARDFASRLTPAKRLKFKSCSRHQFLPRIAGRMRSLGCARDFASRLTPAKRLKFKSCSRHQFLPRIAGRMRSLGCARDFASRLTPAKRLKFKSCSRHLTSRLTSTSSHTPRPSFLPVPPPGIRGSAAKEFASGRLREIRPAVGRVFRRHCANPGCDRRPGLR